MMKLKKQDIEFLKLFTLYQIAELVICFIFNHYTTLAYFRPVNKGEIIDLAWTTRSFIYGPPSWGWAIQYGLVTLIWIICVFWDVKYLKIAKIVSYCSIDMIIPLALPIFCFFCFPYSSGYAHYICWLLGFTLLVICSKVLFFKYYKKRFCPKTVQETNAAIHEKVIETEKLCSSAEECYDEPEGFLCEENLKYYDEMNYSVYADDNQTVLSVVFRDKVGVYCRYFALSESDIESGYEELWRLADTIRANPQSFAEREINIEDLQKENK